MFIERFQALRKTFVPHSIKGGAITRKKDKARERMSTKYKQWGLMFQAWGLFSSKTRKQNRTL